MKKDPIQIVIKILKKKLTFFLLIVFAFANLGAFSFADVQDEITEKNEQVEELQRQIENYQKQIEENKGKARTLQGEIDKLNAQIGQIQLEVRSLEISISATNLEINQTEGEINESMLRIEKLRDGLVGFLRLTNQNDDESLLEILIKNNDLSDFFIAQDNIRTSQEKAKITIDNLRNLRDELEGRKIKLENKEYELQKLKSLQVIERGALTSKKKERGNLLKETKGQETKFQKLVEVSKKDIERIKEQIQFLLQHGITAEEAVKFGQLAAIRADIRPAFLLAILEIESGLGKNVGTGNWLDDMYNCYLKIGRKSRAEAEKAAFFKIVTELGLDPNSVKVSAEPYYGCGGAMGPAQFIPTTWLGYKEEVARLTGHNPPSPWNIEDAFMASATKLAKGGATAKTRTAEIRAAKTYISGRPSCTKRICISYSNAVLRKAAEIEKNLPK